MDDGLVPRRNEVCLQWSKVLILIVVEDGLVQGVRHVQHQVQFVLILVVVDNGLVRHLVTMFSLMLKKVLILVVVDNGLVLVLSLVIGQLWLGLNPCCSGRWSRTDATNQTTNIRLAS